MKITREEVRRLAELSNIFLADEEIDYLSGDLEKIVDYISELSELDTVGVEPTYQVTGLENVWQADEVGEHLTREELLALAPAVRDNCVKVPKVL
ncbi:Asp-tRNA(Asn)/Glu-tRNA(Gln) amidotransferase subunit GatC [Candidatus Saccharibacteria bacterium]|nr:Asp-tRNA(Asn)/Glu-tRNA(Gln) amidotransferase subunit GatC [Candidatus Saccharibacteria bacterium]